MEIPNLGYLRFVAANEIPSSQFEAFASSVMSRTYSTVSSLWNSIAPNLTVSKAVSVITAPDNTLTTSTLTTSTLSKKTFETINQCLGGVQPAFNISVSEVFKAVVSSHVVQETLASPFLPILAAGCVLGIGSVILEEMALNRGKKEAFPLVEKRAGSVVKEKEASPLTEKRAGPVVNRMRSDLFGQPVVVDQSKGKSQKVRRFHDKKWSSPAVKKNLSRQKPTVIHQPLSKGRGK